MFCVLCVYVFYAMCAPCFIFVFFRNFADQNILCFMCSCVLCYVCTAPCFMCLCVLCYVFTVFYICVFRNFADKNIVFYVLMCFMLCVYHVMLCVFYICILDILLVVSYALYVTSALFCVLWMLCLVCVEAWFRLFIFLMFLTRCFLIHPYCASCFVFNVSFLCFNEFLWELSRVSWDVSCFVFMLELFYARLLRAA